MFKVFYRDFKYDLPQWNGHRFYVVDQETYDVLCSKFAGSEDIIFEDGAPSWGAEVHIGRYLSAGYGVELPPNNPSYTDWTEYPYHIFNAKAVIWDEYEDEIVDLISIPIRPVENKEITDESAV